MDEMDYTMQASVHPVPLPGWWVNSAQVRGQSRCPYRSGMTEGAASGTQTGGFEGGSVLGTTEGAGGSQPNHGQSTTTTTPTTTASYHQQQSSLPHPPPLLPPASTLHHSFFLHSGYSDNSLPLPHHQSHYFLPPLQIQQLSASHGPTPPSFPSHLSDPPPPPTSHSANRGYDPVHAASNSNNSMNSQGRTGQESDQDNSGNAGHNMNNQGGNLPDGYPASGHAHQYGGNGNNNNNANTGNVTAPTTGVSTMSVSVRNTVSPGPTWMPGQFTTTNPPYSALAFPGQPGLSHLHYMGPVSSSEQYGMNGGSSGNMMRGQGARPAANPVSNSSADADTVMGNTEAQGGSGGSSAAPTAASAAPQVGGSGSGPIQSGHWTPQQPQGQSRSAFPFPPEPSTPAPPGLSPIVPGYMFSSSLSSPRALLHPHHLAALGNNSTSTPSQVLPDPDPWGLRHTRPITGVIIGSYHPPPGPRRQPSHQSPQPAPPVTTASSTGSHIRLPAPEPRSRLPPYRSSGMSNPTESGNDLSHALQPPQVPPSSQGPQASSSSTHRPSRQRPGSGLANTATPLPDTQSRSGSAIASASAPTSASASNIGTPAGQSTSFSRGPAYPEMRTEMRDYLVRALNRSDSFSDDDLDLPDEIPGRRSISEEEAARLEERAAEFQERAAQMVRARQVARGQSTKKVASKKAIESLEPVNVADLPETDRICDICYNDYGTVSPEGVTEQPLRIPMCKHVFGEHCIKKWFQDSNSCPYCRAELPTQQIYTQASAQSIREFLDSGHFRRHGNRAQQELLRHMVQLNERYSGPRAWQAGGRRSPPSENTGTTRRGARHGTLHQRQSSSGPSAQSNQRPPRERPVSDSDNLYRSANTNQTPPLPQQPPAASYTSEPAPPWMLREEGSFGFGPSNRDHAFPDQVPSMRGPAQGQPAILEQRDQPLAPPYPGDNTFPGSSTFTPPSSGRQWPQ
ncbi:hypothetical protein QBC32DRAFT_150766 [Pseudoneurospora amorphoporcata]|uniref:RING-type domain-containing protein n=1 Tax=Pseudoneurospora amorphoporcata TaxID=241081 RepID=A0AAN6NVV2_9PEZI|nr:hypothetical protein QBC32DRAFT_150766 [Pseudoneurospora amorphoporcata]